MLDHDAGVPPVAVMCTGVDPITSAAVCGPSFHTLLEPNRQQSLRMPAAEIPAVRSGRNLEQWKCSNLRSPLPFLDETDLDAQLGVSVTVAGGSFTFTWHVEDKRSDHVELNVRQRTIVHFQVRRRSGPRL